jgi:hypothetical protein
MDNPVSKEGSDSPKKMTMLLITCFKWQINRNTGMTAAELKLSLPELSSTSEESLQHHLQTTHTLSSKIMKDFLAQPPFLGQ